MGNQRVVITNPSCIILHNPNSLELEKPNSNVANLILNVKLYEIMHKIVVCEHKIFI